VSKLYEERKRKVGSGLGREEMGRGEEWSVEWMSCLFDGVYGDIVLFI